MAIILRAQSYEKYLTFANFSDKNVKNCLQFHNIARLWYAQVAETGIMQMILERSLCQRFAVYDKCLFHLLRIDALAQVIGHLLIVAMAGESLNLDDARGRPSSDRRHGP